MRVLVTGRNAKVLAKAAGALSNDLKIATATTKAAALSLLDYTDFDLVIACENLGDGSGLEVLSHVAVTTPNTLRIFAARPATLDLLKGELGLFGLFRTLSYPINFRLLWSAISLARSCGGDPEAAEQPASLPTAATAAKAATTAPPSAAPTSAASANVRHVVLDETWDAGEIFVDDTPFEATVVDTAPALVKVSTVAKPSTAGQVSAVANVLAAAKASAAAAKARAVGSAPGAASPNPAGKAPTAPSPDLAGKAAATANPNNGASGASLGTLDHAPAASRASIPSAVAPPAGNAASRQPPARIPESDAFKRALARRNQARNRQEPSVSGASLAELARLTTSRRSTHALRPGALPANRRTALFVGSGVFAAAAAVVLTFLMLHTNKSMAESPLPLVASMDRSGQQKAMPWAPNTMAPPPGIDPSQPSFVPAPPDATPSTDPVADAELRAEAASEQAEIEPGYPAPPPPNPPPGPSEPPAYDASGMPTQ